MLKKILIYGAGGFGKEVASIINKINEIKPEWNIIGFIDDGVRKGTYIAHYGKVLGDYSYLNGFAEAVSVAFAIGSPKTLKSVVERIDNALIEFPNIFHPEVYFADPVSFKIGRGNVVVRGCSFSVDVTIGNFNQFNSISALAHDVTVGDYNVLMPLTRISGETSIGNGNFFGIGAVALQGIKIGNDTRIGAGSYIMRSTQDGHLYFGNPAKKTNI